ncbi:metal-binding protein [Vibrio parahaemolyticus]|nr:metal-binding protein [Vibrio parahaemolyticus]EHH1260449.1 metal-binding protein [Vibrio parahaemolyticus]
MGKYSQKISERINHSRIIQGYCLICGKHGRLSIDHVPPKGAVTITKVEQIHISEVSGYQSAKIKAVPSTNGSKFRTICQKCNSERLGANDKEVARVHRELTEKIRNYFSDPFNPYNVISIEIDPIKYARAMIGHILSATSVEECKNEPEGSPYFDPLKRFVLGDDFALDESHDIHYWFYPSDRHISAKMIGFFNEGHACPLSILSFYPIAFLVTPKNKGIYPYQAKQFDLASSCLYLDLSSYNIKYADFPFAELKGNSMYAFTDFQTIISYPVRRKKCV